MIWLEETNIYILLHYEAIVVISFDKYYQIKDLF